MAALIVSCSPSYALDPQTPLVQYIHTSWTSDAGLVAVRRLSQTPDGYLWLATRMGLKRFDGVRFSTYFAGSEKGLESSTTQDLLVDGDGSLWIATLGGGISHYQRGAFQAVTSRDALPSEDVESLYRDRSGVLWEGSSDGRIARLVNGRFEHMSLGIPSVPVMSFVEDSDQSLWIATFGGGVFRFRDGTLSSFSVRDGLPDDRVSGLCRDRSGTIWTTGWKGISFWNGTQFVPARAVNALVKLTGKCLEDRDGNLWITSSSGLVRVHGGQVSKIDRNSGLSADFVSDVLEDREGNLWVATRAGLDRLRDGPIRAFSSEETLMRDAGPIVADDTAGVWLVSGNQLARIASDKVTSWPLRMPGHSRPLTMLPQPGSRFLIGFDRGGILWSPNTIAPVPEIANSNVRSMLKARDGGIWLATADRGLLHWSPGSQSLLDTGIRDQSIVTLAEDRSGGIWAGSFYGGGLYHLTAQGVLHFSAEEGLPSARIYTLFVDAQNKLWIGSARGLGWLEDGRIQTVGSRQGLQSDLVWAIVDDAYDRLWFAGYGGIETLTKKSLVDWSAGRLERLTPHVYHRTDGLQVTTIDRPFPNAVRSPDGNLWFCITDGVLRVTPPKPGATMSDNFRVLVEDVTIDHAQHFEPKRLSIPPGARSIEVRYTALTLTSPETVRFRYKLEGFENDWVDANVRRVSYYSNLRPGTYAFKVEASAGDEQWLASPPLLLEQIPFFYQTKWFLLLVSATAASLTFFMYRLRLHFALGRIEARHSERMRIARELHDTLLQSFQGVLLMFRTAQTLIATRPAEAQQAVEDAIAQARAAITEGRSAVQGLRPSVGEPCDFNEAIKTLGEELAKDSAHSSLAALTMYVEGTPRALKPLVRDEIFRIASEALRNAYRHATASRIELQVDYGDRRFNLRVRDNGKGIDSAPTTGGALPGHFGLRGMRERANEIGGKFRIWSAPGFGTEVELTVPASRAYGSTKASRRPDLVEVRHQSRD